MSIKETLAEWGINAIALVAGFIGAFIAVTISEKEISFRSAMAQISCAIGFAGYGAEWLGQKLHLSGSPSACGLMGLVLGICGLYVARGIIKYGKAFEKNPTSFIPKPKSDDVDPT